MIQLFDKKEKKPKSLRARNILLVFLFVIFVEFLFFSNQMGRISFEDILAKISPAELVELTNIRREDRDIDTLQVDPELIAAAMMKAEDMADKGYFAHTSPDGVDPWHWFDEAGYDYQYAGENLAVNFSESYQVDRAWMRSPSHRENIINQKFEDIGIATATGEYKGDEATFVVQLFGKRSADSRPPFRMGGDEEDSSEEEESVVLGEGFEQEINGDEQPEKEDEPLEDKRVETDEDQEEPLEDKKVETEKQEEKKEESFALIEKSEKGPEVALIGSSEIFKSIDEGDKEYVSFWGRLSDRPIISIFVGLVAFLSLVLVGKFKSKRTEVKLVAFNQAVVMLTVLLALLTKHYLIEFTLYL